MGVEDHIRIGQKLEITVWDPEIEDENGYIFSSSVLDFRQNRLFVENPKGEEAFIKGKMEPGMIVGVVLPTDANLLMFYPQVGTSPLDNHFGTILNLPPDMQIETIQRRKLIRVPFTVPVGVEILHNGDVVHKIDAATVNISGGGMRIACMFSLEEELRVVIYLKIGDLRGKDAPPLEVGLQYTDKSVLKLHGKVVFAQENTGSTVPRNEKYVAGIYFDQLSELQQTLLMRECFRRELTLKRNKAR